MNLIHFITNFAAQFDGTYIEEFKAETKFREIEEWSSLSALSVIAMADEEYNVALKGDDIRNSQTIMDLYVIVCSRLSL